MSAAGDYEKFIKAVGHTIQEQRLAQGLTQTDLAKLSGRNQSFIAKIENGPVPNVGIKVIYDLAIALSLPIAGLLETAALKAMPESRKRGDGSSILGWKRIQDGLESLPLKKRKALENIFLELIRNSLN